MNAITLLALATSNETSTAASTAPESIWGEIRPGEIALLGAGVLLTIVVLVAFIWVAVRASRDEKG